MSKRKPSGDGMVRKRDDGQWEGRIVVGHKENGDSIFRYIYAGTQKELTALLRQNIDIYQGIDLTEQSRMTHSEWLDQWLGQMATTLRPSTLEHYRKDMENHVIPNLGKKALTQVTAADLRKLYNMLKRSGRINPRSNQDHGLSDNMINNIHVTLHHVLKSAVEQGLIPTNPADEVEPPKTKAGNRSVILPEPVLNVLRTYRDTVTSKWIFPSPVNEDSPRDPAAVRNQLQTILERAECKKVRFHDLRHVFCTASLEHGMDVKTLSTILGHVSSSTTLNVYAHVTDEMRRTAAAKIDHGIGKAEPQIESNAVPQKPAPSTFQAYKGKRRKAGTGCVTQINDRLWEGRYSPVWPANGKKHSRNVYAHSEAECEKFLAELIVKMKAEINAEKERLKTD